MNLKIMKKKKRKENEEVHVDQKKEKRERERERERERNVTYISWGGVEGLKNIFNSHPSIFHSPSSFPVLISNAS